jgi:hypothetical protein
LRSEEKEGWDEKDGEGKVDGGGGGMVFRDGAGDEEG